MQEALSALAGAGIVIALEGLVLALLTLDMLRGPGRWWHPWFAPALRERIARNRLPHVETVVARIEQRYDPESNTLADQARDMLRWAESGPDRGPAWEQFRVALRIVQARHPDWAYSSRRESAFALDE